MLSLILFVWLIVPTIRHNSSLASPVIDPDTFDVEQNAIASKAAEFPKEFAGSNLDYQFGRFAEGRVLLTSPNELLAFDKNVESLYKRHPFFFDQPIFINYGDERIGTAPSSGNNVPPIRRSTEEHKPLHRVKRYSYYQPYGYSSYTSYNTGRYYGTGYGYGSRGYGGYGGTGYGYGSRGYGGYGYRPRPRPGRVLGAAVLVGGAAFTGGLIGSRLGRRGK